MRRRHFGKIARQLLIGNKRPRPVIERAGAEPPARDEHVKTLIWFIEEQPVIAVLNLHQLRSFDRHQVRRSLGLYQFGGNGADENIGGIGDCTGAGSHQIDTAICRDRLLYFIEHGWWSQGQSPPTFELDRLRCLNSPPMKMNGGASPRYAGRGCVFFAAVQSASEQKSAMESK